MRAKLALVAAMVMMPASASAWFGLHGLVGNDRGGIIPWSPAVKYVYRDIAAAHCAQYNQVARITSVHPWYGSYIGFDCRFPRGYDPVRARYLATVVHAGAVVRVRY